MSDGIWTLMDVIFIAAGVYGIYAFILMKVKGEIKTQLLLNKDVDLKKCKDLEGYKAYVAPKLLIFSIGCAVYGAVGLIDYYVISIPTIAYWILLAVFFAIIIWFAVVTKKSVEKFW